MQYFTAHSINSPKNIELHKLPANMTAIHRPAMGMPMGASYEKLCFDVAASRPGKSICDVIRNAFGYFMISERLKPILDRTVNSEIEYLPFEIRNKKGKIEPLKFYMVNVLGSHSCLDTTKSQGELKSGSNEQYSQITRVVLDAASVPNEKNIFRLSHRPRILIFREDLVQALISSKITGVDFRTTGEPISL